MADERNRFRLLVFDWDGTLMDSAASIAACMRRSLQDLELTPPAESDLRATIGLGLDEIFRRICPQASRSTCEQIVARYRHHWNATYRQLPLLFPGAHTALRALAGQDYFLAIATGKGRPGLEHDLGVTGLGELFLATRTAHDAPSKPNPQMLLEIMDELGVDAEETLMIGDTSFDLEMARQAKVAAIGVLSGAHSHAELVRCTPLACLDGVSSLPAWLDQGE